MFSIPLEEVSSALPSETTLNLCHYLVEITNLIGDFLTKN